MRMICLTVSLTGYVAVLLKTYYEQLEQPKWSQKEKKIEQKKSIRGNIQVEWSPRQFKKHGSHVVRGNGVSEQELARLQSVCKHY